MNNINAYDDSNIKVLSDLAHIRKRPTMYISIERPSYQMWSEIADNAVDESINGYATEVIFNLDYENSTITVADNGRGLPQGINKTLNKPTVEVIYTKLNAGGKYDHDSYTVSGGLNGVGSTVVNALSKDLHVKTWRGHDVVEMDFEYGETRDHRTSKDKSLRGNGTSVTYTIDTDHHLFTDKLSDYEKDISDKIHLLKTLIPKVNFIYNGEEIGVRDFREFLILTKEPLFEESLLFEYKNLLISMNWSVDTNRNTSRSFCNAIQTPNGGDHEKAVYDVINDILGSDGSLGLNLAVSCMYSGVEFDSQAKLKAISKDMRAWIKDKFGSEFKSYLRRNPEIKDSIYKLMKKKRDAINKRNNKSTVRRDKKTTFLNALGSTAFADCTVKDRSKAELFIVEGNSAAGSARQARDVDTQAVAPLRGKFINSFNSSIDALLKNNEVGMLLSSIDCGAFEDVDVEKSRYNKIIIMADADPDGKNIASLLLSFFLNVTPKLLEEGYIYLALPPLYGTTINGKFVPINTEDEKNEYLSKGYSISRFKGLGEMNPEQLNISCMNPDTRNIIQITTTEECYNIVENIMGGDSSYRKKLLIDTGVLDE